MKTKLLILSALLIVSSCATKVPEKLTSDDCLVILKTTVTNPDDLNNARNYYFTVTDIEDKVKISKKEDDYIFLFIRNDSSRIESIQSKVSGENVIGEATDDELGFLLPYEPGKLIIADFMFNQTLVKISPREILNVTSFDIVEEDEKALLLNQIQDSGHFNGWF